MIDLARVFYRQIGLSDTVFKAPHVTLFQAVMAEKSPAEEKNELIFYGDIVSDMAKQEAESFGVTDGLISPTDFKTHLKEVANRSKDDIRIRMNSRGGEVFAAGVMYQAMTELRQSGRRIETIIDGVAASAASFVMLASNAVHAHRLSSVMIHRGHGIAMGNAEDFRHMAGVLEGQDRKVAPVYAKAMNTSEDDVLALMSKETWFHGKEIVDAGLANVLLSDGDKSIEQKMRSQEMEMSDKMSRRVWQFAQL